MKLCFSSVEVVVCLLVAARESEPEQLERLDYCHFLCLFQDAASVKLSHDLDKISASIDETYLSDLVNSSDMLLNGSTSNYFSTNQANEGAGFCALASTNGHSADDLDHLH